MAKGFFREVLLYIVRFPSFSLILSLNPDLTRSRRFNPDFIERPVQLPEFYPNTITDIAYQT